MSAGEPPVSPPVDAPAHGRLTRNGLIAPVAIVASFAVWQVEGVAALYPIAIQVGFIAIVVFCFGRYRIDNPLSYLSIVGPAVAVAIVGLVRFPDPFATVLASLWLLFWISPLGRLLWPWWQRNVLRRMRPGTPEREMLEASKRVWEIASPPLTQATWEAAWTEIGNAARWMRPHTVAIHAAMQSWVHVLADGTQEVAERVVARWREEVDRLWAWVQTPTERARIDLERLTRPTRGTCLEYEYPRLEALLATGSDQEQRRIRAGSARIALSGTGLMTPDLEQLLADAEDRQIAAECRVVVENLLATFDTQPGPSDDPGRRRRARERHALVSLHSAVMPLEWPLDAADAVYEAARSSETPRAFDDLESMMVGILGQERAETAHEIPSPQPSAGTDGRHRPEPAAYVDRIRASPGASAWLVGTAFAAGSIGFLAGQTADRWLTQVSLYPVLFLATAMAVLSVGAAVSERAMSDRDVTTAVVAAVVALVVTSRLVSPMYLAVGDLIAGDWRLLTAAESHTIATLLHGVSMTIAVVATYWIIRASKRQRRLDRPSPRTSDSPSVDGVAA